MIIGFIGVGKMATAIINGLNKSSHRIIISGSSLARSRQIAEELEVEAAASHQELVENADLIILGIKPQMFDKVLTDLNFHQPIMSMAAGVTLERLASLTSADLPLIRIMPNLNAQILKSTTGLCTNDKVSEDLLVIAKEITDSFGTTVELAEKDFDTFTALAGSSTAYILLTRYVALVGPLSPVSWTLSVQVSPIVWLQVLIQPLPKPKNYSKNKARKIPSFI